ncbi:MULTISPECIES: hypothetical protein [unclassified Streptomyces]|uniref:hypothetical protein n=1 Tax=unclassified Streptomyces TaxID=2593676 RepID=UPI002E2D5273|nr:hypothetical protein [Streptomyces sp. NBC_00223]
MAGAATDQSDDGTDEALAYVCRRLDYLRRLLTPGQVGGGDPPELRALTTAVTAARRPGHGELRDLLQELHRVVQAAGDPLGVWQASAGRGFHLPGIPGIPGGSPFEALYLCPMGSCAGRHPDQSTVFPLTCAITGRELERTIL